MIWGYEIVDQVGPHDPDYEEPRGFWATRMSKLKERFKRLRATNPGTRYVEQAHGRDDYGEEGTKVPGTKREE